MPDTSIVITPLQGWLMIGLITILIIIIGYIGQIVIGKMDMAYTQTLRQVEVNKSNDKDHTAFNTRLNSHSKKINSHGEKISVLERVAKIKSSKEVDEDEDEDDEDGSN
jgi:hypothetical protein